MNLQRYLLLPLALVCFVGALGQPVLRPGDVVTIRVQEEPELNGDYTVTDTGLILMQFIGAVEVRGLTEDAAANKISRTLTTQQILRTATVTLRIKQRDQLPITFGGAVRSAGEVEFREGMRLADVLDTAGPTVAADLTAVRVTHTDGTTTVVDYTRPEGNIALKSGDRVFVPLKVAAEEVTVLGAVIRPGIIEYRDGMTLSQAIAAAGGFRSDAERSRIAVRFAVGGTTVVNLDVEGTDVALSRGDQVTVPIRAATEYVFVRGAISRPGLIPHSPTLTLMQAVNEAVPVEGARLDRIRLIRRDAEGESVTRTFNIQRIALGSIADEPLLPGDVVDVPYPARSFGVQDTMQVVGIALLIFFLLRSLWPDVGVRLNR